MKKVSIIAIVGPTTSGKSDLAVQLTKKLNGEIISADSRQVYRGLDVGTGKVTQDKVRSPKSEIRNEFQNSKFKVQNFYHKGTRHHLLDVANPKRQFTVVDYQKLAQKAIFDITKRGKIPIVCGGTGLYIDALLYNIKFPSASINTTLRNKLEKLETKKLFAMLRAKGFRRAKTIDPSNRRRLIRALEIIYARKGILKLNAPIFSGYAKREKWQSPYNVLIIGIRREPNELRARIDRRLKDRLPGIIREVEKLHASDITWKRLESFGLEYRWASLLIRKKLPHHAYENSKPTDIRIRGFSQSDIDALYSVLRAKIWQYAKRQTTWFKRNPNIVWPANEKVVMRLATQHAKNVDM